MLRLFAEQTREHAILLLDIEGRIVWWSPGAENVFGYSHHEMLGQRPDRLFTAEDLARGIPENEIAIARAHGRAEDDRWLVRRDGSRFWATGMLVPICDGDNHEVGFAKLMRNRTDIREQVETLRNRAEAAEIAGQRKDVFLSTLSHELRNPLAPLQNSAAMLAMLASKHPEIDPPLRILQRQLDSLRRLVDDLLDVTRIGAGKMALRREVIAVHSVVEAAMEAARPLIQAREHSIETLFPPMPILVTGDPDRLRQVFVNLLNNAAKYTPPGGRIWVKGTVEGDEAVTHIEDDGVGIPGEMLPRIFELFTQADTASTDAPGGLGIGLALVKDIVTLHGGAVQVRSDGPGQGSVFSVRLPLEQR